MCHLHNVNGIFAKIASKRSYDDDKVLLSLIAASVDVAYLLVVN